MGLKEKLKDFVDLLSLFKGLGVTGDAAMRRQVTVHYPRQQVDNLDSFRGPLTLLPKPKDPTKPKCIACMMCMSTCPSGCIKVVKKKAPKPTPQEEQALAKARERGEKVKKPTAPKEPASFQYNYSYCSLCGLCVEVCPVTALGFSNEAYMVSCDRKTLDLDLIGRLQRRAADQPRKDLRGV
jgi:NADH-quinone oxidoreductase subunit I